MNRLNSVSASEHIQALYRLLLIRTGRRVRAEQALRETLTGSLQGTPSSQNQPDYVDFYRTALKLPANAQSSLKRTSQDGPWHFITFPNRNAQRSPSFISKFSVRAFFQKYLISISRSWLSSSAPPGKPSKISKPNPPLPDSIWYGATAFFSTPTGL